MIYVLRKLMNIFIKKNLDISRGVGSVLNKVKKRPAFLLQSNAKGQNEMGDAINQCI